MRLKITTPGQAFEFSPREGMTSFVVGNRDLDDIHIADDPKVSGPHVRLEKFGSGWSFTDQFSDAGTVHNGAKTYNADLKAGDVLRVGDTEITVLSLEEVPAPTHAPEPTFDTSIPAAVEPPKPSTGLQVLASVPVLSVHAQRLFDRLVGQFETEHGISLRDDAARQRVRHAAELAVKELEAAKSTDVNLPFLTSDASGPKHLNVRLARKHLHEAWLPPGTPRPAPVRTPPSSSQPTSAMKGKAKSVVGAVIVMSFIIFGGVVLPWLMDESADDIQQDIQRTIEDAETRQKTADERNARELTYTKAVQALMDDKETAPQALLDGLDQLEAQAKAEGFSIGWDYQRARTYLESHVYSDVSRRSNDVGLEVYNLQEKKNFREALKEIDALQVYLDSSPHNQYAVKTLELDESLARWRETNERGNDRLIYSALYNIEEMLSRDDFPQASVELLRIIDNAVIASEVRTALESERAQVERQASLQWDEKLPAPRPPFDRRKDRLPAAPSNTLLPDGDTSARREVSTLRTRVKEQIEALKWDGRKWSVWRLEFEVQGDARSSQVTLIASLPVGAAKVVGREVAQLANLPAPIQLVMMEQVESGGVQERLALLTYCFDNGLMDDAGRMALKVRESAPDKRAELDEILAAKWNVPVPEGGFPERDGRVVPK